MSQITAVFNYVFTQPIFNGLMLLYHLFGDFALSIIVLTVIIKLILFPLTLQQLKSMKATQALQPQIAEIRKKYAKDQQAQLAATQALYKEYGVNPVAGCLPLLIQLPVLYGLFFALSTVINQGKTLNAINSQLYAFVPHFTTFPDLNLNWFKWLSFLNPILHVNWAWTIPLNHSDPTHILPVLAALATFIQLRMSQPKTTPGAQTSTDPSTQSMKTMQFAMPVITLVFAWSFAAGMALYWTVSSVFQAVQQYFVTGWGSLLVTPSFSLSGSQDTKGSASNTKTVTTERRKERELSEASSQDETENGSSESKGSTNGQLRTSQRYNGNGNSTASRRRQRSGSASARRRGNAQRSRS